MKSSRKWGMFAAAYVGLGNAAIIFFIAIQAIDGAYTYLAIRFFGSGAEGNPILSQWMLWTGEGTALIGAKLFATSLGILLHLRQAHFTVVNLSLLYMGLAVWPWMKFFS